MSQHEIDSLKLLDELGNSNYVTKLLWGIVSFDHPRDFFVALCNYFIVLWDLLPIFKSETMITLAFAREAFAIGQLYEFIDSHPKIHIFQDATSSVDLFGNLSISILDHDCFLFHFNENLDVSFMDLVPFLYMFCLCMNQHLLICTDDDFFHENFILDMKKLFQMCFAVKVRAYLYDIIQEFLTSSGFYF
jgi:hypothetical protein